MMASIKTFPEAHKHGVNGPRSPKLPGFTWKCRMFVKVG